MRAVEDLVDILDHLGYAQATFIGHSMGGNITQELVFFHPERVKALVMLGCTCNTLKLSVLEALGVRMAPLIFPLYSYEVLKRQSARASAVKPEVQSYLSEVFNQVSKEEFITILVETSRCLHYEPGYRITHPMLLAHGDHDITGNIKKIAPTWAARDPNCRYVVIPEAGHAANLDKPEFFNRLLLDFLHEHAPTTAES